MLCIVVAVYLALCLRQTAYAHRPHDIITALATDQTGTVLLAGTRKRLYQSVDSGSNWRLAGKGLGGVYAYHQSTSRSPPLPELDHRHSRSIPSLKEAGTCKHEYTNPRAAFEFAPSYEHGTVVFFADAGTQRVHRSNNAGLSFDVLPVWVPPHDKLLLTGVLAISPDFLTDSTIFLGATYVRCVVAMFLKYRVP